MKYDFINSECTNPDLLKEAGEGVDRVQCQHLMNFPMKDAPDLGSLHACPAEGCPHRVMRVISTDIQIGIKSKEMGPTKHGQIMQAKVGGKDIQFQFMDHEHTDPRVQGQLEQMAAAAGVGHKHNALKGAYRNKEGRMVVDVKSNVPDPLGAIEREKKKGDFKSTTRKINTPYKRRK